MWWCYQDLFIIDLVAIIITVGLDLDLVLIGKLIQSDTNPDLNTL